MSRLNRVGLIAMVVVIVVGGLIWVRGLGSDTITVTASFPQTIGLYTGDGVRVVGVPMGRITAITAEGTSVRVTMTLDRDTPVAAATGAVIVPPGILSSRYIQLTKPWLSGPKLVNGATIASSRTAAPLELDDVTRQLNSFLAALGPRGANRNGALAELISSSASALGGNGATLRQTLSNVANALDTLGNSRGNIVTTLQQLQTFISSLAGSSAAIRTLEHGLADVSTQLADQRVQLRRTIVNVSATVGALSQFVNQNGDKLSTDVRLLTRLSVTLQDRKRDLEEILDLAAPGVEGIFGAANLSTGVLDARIDLTPLLAHSDTTICQLLESLAVPQLCPSSVPAQPGALKAAHKASGAAPTGRGGSR